MIARRIDRDRQIFEQHMPEIRPLTYRNTAQALADCYVTSLLVYCARSGRGVPLHWGMRVFGDEDAPWGLLPATGWKCEGCGLWVGEEHDDRYCPHCDRKRPAGPEE